MQAGKLSVFLSALGLTGVGGLAEAATQQTLWRGVDRLVVSCPPDAAGDLELHSSFCRAVVREAGRGAPYPVLTSAAARPTAKDVVLHVDVRIARAAPGGAATLSFSILPVRDDPRAETAPPARPGGRRIRLSLEGRGGSSDLNSAIAAELDRVLPWRSRRRGAIARSE